MSIKSHHTPSFNPSIQITRAGRFLNATLPTRKDKLKVFLISKGYLSVSLHANID